MSVHSTLLHLLCSGRWQQSPSLSVITSLSMPYFVFLSFHPSSHTLAHMFKGSLALSTVLILAFYGSLKNFLSVPHSLVVKCIVAYLFPIPSDNRHYSVEFQILMFVPFWHAISFNYVQTRFLRKKKKVIFCDFYILNIFNRVPDLWLFFLHFSRSHFPHLFSWPPGSRSF